MQVARWIMLPLLLLAPPKQVFGEARLTVPNEVAGIDGNAESHVPFGALGDQRYQQLYDESQFPTGRYRIDEISFRVNVSGGSVFDGRSYTRALVRLSTTDVEPPGLSANFDENHGPRPQVVYDGPLVLSSGARSQGSGGRIFDVEIPFDGDYLYDRARGNLLVDLTLQGASGAPPPDFDAVVASSGSAVVARVISGRRGLGRLDPVSELTGLATQFRGDLQPGADNLVFNPDFSRELEDAGWEVLGNVEKGYSASFDQTRSNDSGSLLVINKVPNNDAVYAPATQCVPVESGERYRLEGWVHLLPAPAFAIGSGSLNLSWSDGPDCDPFEDEIDLGAFSDETRTTREWVFVATPRVSPPAGKVAALIRADVRKDSASDPSYEARFDSIYFGVPEPSPAALGISALLGLAGLAAQRRRRAAKAPILQVPGSRISSTTDRGPTV
ncbi:MAG: hypothetical protein QNK03_07045 [Myxococcota bacterium]|nr:hypothetical protein [Myxococcota bacterium]